MRSSLILLGSSLGLVLARAIPQTLGDTPEFQGQVSQSLDGSEISQTGSTTSGTLGEDVNAQAAAASTSGQTDTEGATVSTTGSTVNPEAANLSSTGQALGPEAATAGEVDPAEVDSCIEAASVQFPREDAFVECMCNCGGNACAERLVDQSLADSVNARNDPNLPATCANVFSSTSGTSATEFQVASDAQPITGVAGSVPGDVDGDGVADTESTSVDTSSSTTSSSGTVSLNDIDADGITNDEDTFDDRVSDDPNDADGDGVANREDPFDDRGFRNRVGNFP